jgi:hypothetical protein
MYIPSHTICSQSQSLWPLLSPTSKSWPSASQLPPRTFCCGSAHRSARQHTATTFMDSKKSSVLAQIFCWAFVRAIHRVSHALAYLLLRTRTICICINTCVVCACICGEKNQFVESIHTRHAHLDSFVCIVAGACR